MRLALHDMQRYMLLDSQGPDASIPTKAKAGQPLPLRSGSRLKHCLERGLCRLRHSRRQQLRPFFHQLIPGWSHPFHTILLPDPIVQTPFKNKASRKDELPLCDSNPGSRITSTMFHPRSKVLLHCHAQFLSLFRRWIWNFSFGSSPPSHEVWSHASIMPREVEDQKKIFLEKWPLLRCCCCKLRIWRCISFKSVAAVSERSMAENICFGRRIATCHTLVYTPNFARATRIAKPQQRQKGMKRPWTIWG